MIHESVVMFGREHIRIAPTARIDAFCVLSAGPEGIEIGDYVHLSVGVTIYGGGGKVSLENHVAIAARGCLYTVVDNFMVDSGGLIGPLVPERFRNVTKAPVTFRKHSCMGAGSVVLPGVTLGWGAAAGALSLVRDDVPDCHVVVGTPARFIGERDRLAIKENERVFLESLG